MHSDILSLPLENTYVTSILCQPTEGIIIFNKTVIKRQFNLHVKGSVMRAIIKSNCGYRYQSKQLWKQLIFYYLDNIVRWLPNCKGMSVVCSSGNYRNTCSLYEIELTYFETKKSILAFLYIFLMHQNSLFLPENIVMSDMGDYIPLVKSKGYYIYFFLCSELDSVCWFHYVLHQKWGHNEMFLAKFCFYWWWLNVILYTKLLALVITKLNVVTSTWKGTVGKEVEHPKLCLPIRHIKQCLSMETESLLKEYYFNWCLWIENTNYLHWHKGYN